MKYAAININFDSLGETYGFPQHYKDPSFFEVSERFLKIADKYNFKYSIYIIGKDLEKPENRDRLKRWSSLGHEIGNHSWSHPLNLGAMNKSEIYIQVKKADDIIRDTIGIKPKGFIAPGWSTSSTLLEVLIELGYSYDTSSFPSWIMFPSIVKNIINHIGSHKLLEILNRKDYLLHLFGSRKPYKSSGKLFGDHTPNRNKITVLPLPTNKYRMACWHTLAFMLGEKIHERILRSCLNEIDAFYYLIHPADLMDTADLDPTRIHRLERMSEPLDKKIYRLEKSIEIILGSGRKIITMQELADKIWL